LADGYDASFNENWKDAYDNDENGSNTLFVNHEIDILQTFNAGDTILIRFRLYSDPFAAAWGWAIDNLQIQTDNEVTSLNDAEILSDIALYPNPSNGKYSVELNNVLKGNVKISVVDLQGKEVYQENLNNFNGYQKFSVDISQLPKGIYFMKLSNGENAATKRLILQ